MSDSITITIPWPDKLNDPNARSRSYRAVAAHKKNARKRAWLECKSMPDHNKQWQAARVEVTAYHKTARYRDCQNIIAMLKASIDGVEDAGVIVNDNGLEWAPVKREKDKDNPRIELVFTKIG